MVAKLTSGNDACAMPFTTTSSPLRRQRQHRYGGHVNSSPKVKLGKAMVPLGIANVQLDLPGHGYSEGERAYATHYLHWVDDIFQVPLFLPPTWSRPSQWLILLTTMCCHVGLCDRFLFVGFLIDVRASANREQGSWHYQHFCSPCNAV